MPAKPPIGLTDEFANDPTRQAIWKAFLLKSEIAPKLLPDIVRDLANRLRDPLDRARKFFDDAQ